MTVFLADDLVLGQAPSRRWCPMLSSSAPGLAVAVPMPDRLRLIVLELARPNGLDAKFARSVSRSAFALNASGLADHLAGEHGSRSRCSSVAIADLTPDGGLNLQVRAAPPALLLSPGKAARLLPGASSEMAARPELLAGGDILVLCSATFLEDPPSILGTVRRSLAEDAQLARLRHMLRESGHPGATASVAVPSPSHLCV